MNCDFSGGQILLIDKPKDWTSFDVVAKVRNLITKYTGQRVKVGHAGTLDPMATGLLILATGKKTKMLQDLQSLDKEYIATIKFGATTPSFDADTPIDKIYPVEHLTQELIEKTLKQFTGKQLQYPPKYSAKRLKGKRAYDLARKGKDFELKPVEIEIKQIQILSLNLPTELTLKLKVSKGTYIRAFARDLGFKLNTGAYLTFLRRTAIGQYSVNEAITISEFEHFISAQCSKN